MVSTFFSEVDRDIGKVPDCLWASFNETSCHECPVVSPAVLQLRSGAPTSLVGSTAQPFHSCLLLTSLDNLGPQTVPQMARARPVSRQHIQILVNSLLEERRVELVDNPAHKRSNLVRLTRSGKRLVGAMKRRELQLLGQLGIDVAVSDLENAAEVHRAVRQLFESERWQHLVGDSRASQRQTSLHQE